MRSISIVVAILALGWILVGITGCASLDDTYQEEVRPRVVEAFTIYFGTDEEGNYEVPEIGEDDSGDLVITDANCLDPTEMHRVGIRHIICQEWDAYKEKDREVLAQADIWMAQSLGHAENVDDSIEAYSATREEVLETLKIVLMTAKEFAE